MVSSCGCIRVVILNDFEKSTLDLINQVRIENNLDAVIINYKLADLAEYRCNDMVSRNYFSHYDPEGKRPKYHSPIGEILGRAKPASFGTPERFLNAWLNSQSHKEVILNSKYRKIGITIVDNNDTNTRIVTIVFSSK